MTTQCRLLILLLALAGLAFAGSSTWVHYRLVTDPTYTSACDVNATFSCSQAYVSRFGSVAGVPVALGGLAWFGLVGLIAAFAEARQGRSGAAGTYIFALSVVGLAAILYLAYASFFVLGTWCLLCIGTYVSVLGIFLVSASSSSVGIGQLAGRLSDDLRAVFAGPATFLVAILYLVAIGSSVAFFPREGSATQAAAPTSAPAADATEAFAASWAQQPRVDLGIDPAGADVLVVKFLDYQCPSCKAAHLTYKPVFERFEASHPGAVRQVIKDYPLSNKCNFSMNRDMHEAACEGAALVRMAAEMGRADEAVDWLFSVPDQLGMTSAAVKAEAERRFGIRDFDARYQTHLPGIQRDVADAQALRVNQTPTYFVNGVRAQTADGWLSAAYFELAIKLELDRAGRQ
ncbi:MAG TPA: vitamin K epoxide reductase family protein [Vicinamibacterales bacterium]|nr:vitamin K epoxide reductase family protein [Vicinamibacterales bacterium]